MNFPGRIDVLSMHSYDHILYRTLRDLENIQGGERDIITALHALEHIAAMADL